MKPRFVYWWDGLGENGEPIAVYRDEKGSDVTGASLLAAGHPLPLTPTYETWKKLTQSGDRCPKCWSAEKPHDCTKREVPNG